MVGMMLNWKMNLIGADKGNCLETTANLHFLPIIGGESSQKVTSAKQVLVAPHFGELLTGTGENWVKELVESDVIGLEQEKVKNILGAERKQS